MSLPRRVAKSTCHRGGDRHLRGAESQAAPPSQNVRPRPCDDGWVESELPHGPWSVELRHVGHVGALCAAPARHPRRSQCPPLRVPHRPPSCGVVGTELSSASNVVFSASSPALHAKEETLRLAPATTSTLQSQCRTEGDCRRPSDCNRHGHVGAGQLPQLKS